MQSGVKLTVAAWAALGLAVALPAPNVCIQNPRVLAGIAYVKAMLGQPESAAQWMERARHAGQSTAAAPDAQAAGQNAQPASGTTPATSPVQSCKREPMRVPSPTKHVVHVPEPGLAYAATFLPADLPIDAKALEASLKYVPAKVRYMSRAQIESLVRTERRAWRMQYHMSVPRPPSPPAAPIS
jgi:hypothetical protein